MLVVTLIDESDGDADDECDDQCDGELKSCKTKLSEGLKKHFI